MSRKTTDDALSTAARKLEREICEEFSLDESDVTIYVEYDDDGVPESLRAEYVDG